MSNDFRGFIPKTNCRARKKFGPKTKLRTYQFLPEEVKWLYETGDGNITLSAENHLLGQEIHADTTITIEGH